MADAYSDIELEQYIKLAMSRWREPANLAKIIGKETMKRLALESGEGAVRRLPALQAAAQKLNLGTNPGQAYNAFVSGLKWRPVPAQVQQAIVKPLTQLTEPRYLLRGITPHSNVVQPFMERGALKSFLHATPHPNVITQYAGSMAPHAAAGVPQAGAGMFGTLQAFKPRAGQSYVPDFVLDATRGAGWARSGWADAVPEIKQLATQTGKDLASAVQGRAYETAVNSQNKRLGTFLYRRARNTVSGASTRDPASLGRLIGDFDIARIPVSQRGKAEGLARQWNTWVNKPVMPAKALKPSAALDAINADAIAKFRTPVAPPVQPAVQPAAPPFMSKVRSWFGGTKAAADDDLHTRFQPDYTPEQLENLGVYDALYRGQAPRLASLGEWKPEWISEHDPKGWAQWYKRYAAGRRLEGEDERQIKRWLSLKARHGGPFAKNPTARRGWALRNWAIDPSKLVPDQAQQVNEMLDEHQRKAMQKFVQEKAAELSSDVSLQEHQQRVADRVSGDDPRLLVYHGLGSGKSLSAIAAAETARRTSGGQYGIVVPASLRGNFQKELSKFAPGSNPEILSYSGLALGKKFQQQPDTLVMDEAQRLRNPDSAASRAAREAAQKAKRLVLLSGTPITNSPTDMASLISMLTNRDITPKEFESRYIGYKSKFPGVIPWLRGAQWGEVPYVKNEKELRQLLEGRVDYHPSKTPEGVDVQEEVIKTPLTKAQQKIQKAIRTKVPPGFLWKLDKEFPMSREELSKMNSFLNGLRQVSLSTQSFRGDRDPLKAFDQSGKLQTAMQNLQKALESDERKKALIYSNFVESGVNPYAAALDRAKIPYGIFHGGISPEARQKALKEYNEGKLRALLIGPAGAEGISTKGTNLIQLLDPHWNEARIQQARGRGLRFDSHAGLPEDLKNVQVQRYLSGSEEPGFLGKLMGKRRQRTGDEVLESLSQNKEQLNEAFRKILREVGTPARKNDQAEEPENV